MTVIDDNNALQIRPPFLISVGIAARPNINLSFSDITGFSIGDTNPSTTLDSEEWPIKEITDLQGSGFPLDGSCSFYVEGAGSENGKLGLKTHIGGAGSLMVSASSEIPALTICTRGEGTITCAGASYEARGVNVIPINATSASLTFASTDEERRIEVLSIIPGVNLSWDNDTLISVELNLRSDLSIENSQWAVSEIDITAYYPDDISEAVSGIADNVPIWYTAGYAGDMSSERRFYLSEPVTVKDNIISIKGRDASGAFGKTEVAAQILNTKSGSGKRELYVKMMHLIRDDAGIDLRTVESAPPATDGTTERSLIFKSNTLDVIIQNIINLSHTGNYWPVFVDGGIPTLRWSKPTAAKWDIYETDCGDIKEVVARNVSRIASQADFGLHSKVIRNSETLEIVRRKVSKDTRYSQNAGGYYWKLSVSNAKDVYVTAESIWWTAARNTYCIIEDGKSETYVDDMSMLTPADMKKAVFYDESVVVGKSAAIQQLDSQIYPNPRRAGVTMVVDPVSYGQVFAENVFIYPNYANLFSRSNITGSFIWKGDPRMQPRDVFAFHRLDGTLELCTIESINLKHSGGGTIAEITYRKGVC